MTTHIQDLPNDEESHGANTSGGAKPSSETPQHSAVKNSAAKLKGSEKKKRRKDKSSSGIERPSMGAMLSPDPSSMDIDEPPVLQHESWRKIDSDCCKDHPTEEVLYWEHGPVEVKC